MSWFKERFSEKAGRLHVACLGCGRSMWFPPSKASVYKTCGGECASKPATAARLNRSRPCATCGTVFTPRKSQIDKGAGTVCSQKCNTKSHSAMNAPAAQERAIAAKKAAIESGAFVYPRGEAHHSWKGGKEGWRARFVVTGILAERVRDYRARNPEKVREFTQSRKRRKHGRLPAGTVSKIGALQKWRCAACGVNVKRCYHVDHIMPLALGGQHEPTNIQLLCPRCNVRKSAKHPVSFMQERGRLL